MVIDAAKGIEDQTWKLLEVCRTRNIPIMTFVNKVDREGHEPLVVLDEIMERLQLDAAPLSWPVGMGTAFQGVLDIAGQQMLLPNGATAALPGESQRDEGLKASVEGLEIAQSALPAFDPAAYREGYQTPVFFGSALRNVGVRQLLDALAQYAPPPLAQPAIPAPIEPFDPEVTGFVFKVQANMDPNHRDRIAFVRLCSGRFTRGMWPATLSAFPITARSVSGIR
jgi:peptide chain release factor 3